MYVYVIIGTVFILWYSWYESLRHGRKHGYPRFFAFESILCLVFINAHDWFHDPFSLLQLASWLLLLVSIFFAVYGFYHLYTRGEPVGDFENTAKIVSTGLYRSIRHPLYASLLFLGTGAFLKSVTSATCILAIINAIALFITAKMEEGEMVERFGDEYRSYMSRTKMFVPFVI
jgi:protein-S-isoprenylcysteine O-methyltransferase Ste14